jgi:hypothetical protein
MDDDHGDDDRRGGLDGPRTDADGGTEHLGTSISVDLSLTDLVDEFHIRAAVLFVEGLDGLAELDQHKKQKQSFHSHHLIFIIAQFPNGSMPLPLSRQGHLLLGSFSH